LDGIFWCASPKQAAQQIKKAIDKKKRYAYITKRWCFIGALLKILPFFLYKRL
jgi:short-subunit dehydrogenase